jgi:hypothetical protein
MYLYIFFNLSIVTYNESTKPVIQLYEKDNLVKHIDASNDVDKVRYIKRPNEKITLIIYLILGFSRCSRCFQ